MRRQVKKGRKPGKFLKQKARHKKSQEVFDKLKKLREGEEVWFTLPYNNGKARCRVGPADDVAGVVLLLKGKRLFLASSYVKDGRYTTFSYTNPGFYENEVEVVGSVRELHDRPDTD